MSVTAAQSAAQNLRTALLDNGVRAVSIELQPGVSSSGWYCSTFKRGMGHHIASRPSQGLTPGLGLVKRGRPDLVGPLCNGYGGYDLTARLITMGWANHPGAGGPWTVPGWGTVPRDNARPYAFGWEFEGGYEPYTDAMHDFMARCSAGTLDWLATLPGNPGPAPTECWDEHKGWAPGRKPDRLGYTTESGRARIAAVRGTRTRLEDYLMPSPEYDALLATANNGAQIASEVRNWITDPNIGLLRQLGDLQQTVAGLTATATAAAAPAAAGGIDYDRIITALADEIDRRARDGDPTTGPAS